MPTLQGPGSLSAHEMQAINDRFGPLWKALSSAVGSAVEFGQHFGRVFAQPRRHARGQPWPLRSRCSSAARMACAATRPLVFSAGRTIDDSTPEPWLPMVRT